MIVRTYEEDEFAIHKWPILMIGGVIAISLLLTASVTMGFFEKAAVPEDVRAEAGTQSIATRSLMFFDEADGTVRVEDAFSHEEIARFPPATGGFVRSSVRSLVHKRRIRGIGPETPFELVEYDNGALSLRDVTTGAAVELASFGKDNRAVFAAMLKQEETR
jgi:putative photosynthetic complex assembly protein